MNNELLSAYTELCASQHAISAAKSLPERFKAVLQWQGDLSAFVIRFPSVLRHGVDRQLGELTEASHMVEVLLAEGQGRIQ